MKRMPQSYVTLYRRYHIPVTMIPDCNIIHGTFTLVQCNTTASSSHLWSWIKGVPLGNSVPSVSHEGGEGTTNRGVGL